LNIRSIRDNVEAFRHFFEDRSGKISSEFNYPPKLIYFFLKMYKAKASYEEGFSRSKPHQDINIEMVLPCVALEPIDHVEAPCFPASGCKFFKSVYPLPKIISGYPNAVTMVKQKGSGDSKQNNYGIFSFVDWFHFEHVVNSRIKGERTQLYYTMQNIRARNHLYVYGNAEEYSNLKGVKVALHPADPLEVAAFPVCGEPKDLCNPLDEEFLIEEELRSYVFEMTFNALVNLKGSSNISDIYNNDNNETSSPNQAGV